MKEVLCNGVTMTIPAPAHAGIQIILFGPNSADGRQIFFDLIVIWQNSNKIWHNRKRQKPSARLVVFQ